jgi:hypothetical protein
LAVFRPFIRHWLSFGLSDIDVKTLLEGAKEEASALRLALTAAKERYEEMKALKDAGQLPTPATTPDAATPNADKLQAEIDGERVFGGVCPANR